jgi:hypothetical protein
MTPRNRVNSASKPHAGNETTGIPFPNADCAVRDEPSSDAGSGVRDG